MAVNVRLAECDEVTLQMEAGGPSEMSADTNTVLVQKTALSIKMKLTFSIFLSQTLAK
jgi:hypothetical protein